MSALPSSRIMPLSMVPSGTRVILVGIKGGRGLARRLTAMGLVPGEELEVLEGGLGGPMMVRVKGIRMALGRGAAHKVLVDGLA